MLFEMNGNFDGDPEYDEIYSIFFLGIPPPTTLNIHTQK
jgi:hypothetical protein